MAWMGAGLVFPPVPLVGPEVPGAQNMEPVGIDWGEESPDHPEGKRPQPGPLGVAQCPASPGVLS